MLTLNLMTRERPFIATYMVTNAPYGTIYIGMSSNLYARIAQHWAGTFDGFTKKHGLSRLVWYEPHETVLGAIRREKALKRYLRDWKINLIERANPHWDDLSLDWDRPPEWKHGPTDE